MQDAISGIVDLERTGAVSLYRQLYDQLRGAILVGRLPAGTRIPASRAMAAQLGIARNTVLAAVEQLAAEGFLDARRGAGTVVAGGLSPELTRAARAPANAKRRVHRLSASGAALAGIARDASGATPMPFLPSIPDLKSFPHDIWARLLRRASMALAPGEMAYGWMSGLPALREALRVHLREARGVKAQPGQIIITSSAQAALDLLVRALLNPGDTVWLEEPGYLGARAAFSGVGARIVPVKVDRDGLAPESAGASPRMIYVTPSHQYPTGRLMPLARRLELLDCADRHDAYVIEDDFDSEFQFQGRPVAALQGLDQAERVLYVGTFAKILRPGIRTGYAVVPAGLAERIARIQRNTGHVVPAAVQKALADFILEGHLRAHIRRMCALYSERQKALVDGLARHCGGSLLVEPPLGGMQLVAELTNARSDKALMDMLAERGVMTRALSGTYLGEPDRQGLILGYAGYGTNAIEKAATALGDVLRA